MAKFELPIYGENDEVLKTYETNIIKWGVFVQAAELQEKLDGASVAEQINAVGALLQSVFAGLTSEELAQADYNDIFNTFAQIVNNGNKIKGGNSKN